MKKLRSTLSTLMVMSMLLVMLPTHVVFAAASRTAVPPVDAAASAVLVEGENGVFVNNAGDATDHAYSGTGFGVLDGGNASKITYTVSAATAGQYKLAFNYIAGPVNGWNNDRSINVYVNGEKSTVTFPGTSSWDDWQYFNTDAELKPGTNSIAIETNGAGNGICIDYFYYWMDGAPTTITSVQFSSQSLSVSVGGKQTAEVQATYDNGVTNALTSGIVYSSENESVAKVDANTGEIIGVAEGTTIVTAQYSTLQTTIEVVVSAEITMPTKAHPNAVVYQAEDASLSGGARFDKGHTGYTGTGFVGGYDNSSTATTTFTIHVPTDGEYFVALRYSAGEVGGWPNDRTVGLSVNGGANSNVSFKGTDSTWNTWDEKIIKVPLHTGENTVSFKCLTNNDNSDAINLDKLSVWAYSANPTIDTIMFESNNYTVSENSTIQTIILQVDSNGVQFPNHQAITYSSSNSAVAAIDATGVITGEKVGEATITAESGGHSTTVTVTVKANPTVTVDFDSEEREADPSMFGYILTPNYDVPDSRLTLLGPLLSRETIPAQNFQAIGDLDGSYYPYESSILQRSLESYKRVAPLGHKWYFLLGMNPSWATGSGGPIDTFENKPIKTELQQERFKQYVKDVLQYYKDNRVTPDFADLTNEYWTGTEETFKGNWEAVREVFSEYIPIVGPGAVGFDGIPDFYIPYVSDNNLSLEGPSWHAYWTSDTYAPLSVMQNWKDKVAAYQSQYPEANGKYIIWEENNAGSKASDDWTRSMANVIRTGITQNIKGTMEAGNANGMSDLLTTNVNEENPAARREIWWVYYMFSQMSGKYVSVSTDYTEDFTAAASKDKEESKVIFVKNNTSGSVNLDMSNQPYSGQPIQVDLYKITSSETNGLEYQYSITPQSKEDLYITINDVAANESWMAVIKKLDAPPSFFFPITPDDGEVAITLPTLTWSTSQGAESYTVSVSANQDMTNPVIEQSGITGTSYTVESPLSIGQKYYWSATAENEKGSTAVSYDTKYAFIVGEHADVPGQFGPYMPSVGAPNESITPEFTWSSAYHATSYRVVVSKNENLSNPVINQSGITNVRGTGMFGPNSQGYYQPETGLDYDTTYYWAVFAANASGERPMNGPVHTFTTKAPGNSPTSFNLTEPANGAEDVSTRAVFSWQPSKNAFFYKFEVSPNADMSNPVIVRDRMIYNRYTTEPNVLLPNMAYYWRVTAYTKDLVYSSEATSGVISFKTEAVPSSPLLYAERENRGKVELRFQPSIGAASYKIKYGTKSGQYDRTISNVTGSPYEVAGLPNGTYYFAVVAENASGESSIWNERSVTLTSSNAEAVTGVTLNKSAMNLTVGTVGNLTATVLPANAANKQVTWISSNTSVATVDSSGKVTAITPGTATVTVKTAVGGKTAQAAVTVTSDSGSGNGNNNGGTGTGNGNNGNSTDNNGGNNNGTEPGSSVFTDLSGYAWAEEAIRALAQHGIIKGTSETTFEPGQGVTRAEFVTLIVRALKLKATVTDNFDDVSKDAYYYEALGIAKQLGMTLGSGANEFQPNHKISRQDMMVLVSRALKIAGIETRNGNESDLNGYSDKGNIASYAAEAVAALVSEGIVKGSGSGKINPQGSTTRAEAAVILYRVLTTFNRL
ncbi:hypothetical protein BBD42_28620 [Paenibacillus sp. BIHB 4019]|uniref:Carbohydrate-binding protein n=1 Tax=Paenibacillus sp. BIHB 4019 TaxID=1870819 RepID=A0A1B2DQP8_9BACL|nr:S-layer homology domain-containing protein [Paenibacillus sp. BIHB 4019]ANY70025.1 hypothetical protein BBD42_28620 [Paenibacillus sp. BIHB 4019]